MKSRIFDSVAGKLVFQTPSALGQLSTRWGSVKSRIIADVEGICLYHPLLDICELAGGL